MKSTLTRLKNLKFKGKTRVAWAERRINEYAEYLEEEAPSLARQLEKTPFAKFNGSPHATEANNDPWHASVALRRKEDFKGSGLSLHVYPDGTVVPSKDDFPTATMTPATKEEVGEDNSCWLDPQYVAQWQTMNQVKASSSKTKSKGKGKARAGPSGSSSSKTHSSAGKYGAPSSTKGKGRAADLDVYHKDPDSGVLYRYAEKGIVVYLDPNSGREYYQDEIGQSVWL